ncbi:MAG TPA: glycosyltransferase [Candidatus Brocadiia bacterium]|nr:glycosyltransferase [Candidatus Brocadiia bacterium]
MDAVKLTVVIPMLNEEANIAPLFDRLFPVLHGMGETFEVVVIDDGSKDKTLSLLNAVKAEHPELCILSFARNFGQHAAVMAGFEAARGEWVVTLDADLQNPPEEIPAICEQLRKGHDLVNTYRMGRQDSSFRLTASKITNNVARRFSGITLRDFGCMLRGYHRDVVKPMTLRKEFRTFIPALAMLYARSPVEIPVGHEARSRGVSNYSFRKLLSLQLDLITSFSIAPLRLLFVLGWSVAGLGLGFGFLLLILRALHGPEWAAQGVFTLFAILFIFIGAQFLAFGLLGEYIGRIYQEVRSRPTYLLRKTDVENNSGKGEGEK